MYTIVLDLINILKMIGPILQFYQCESLNTEEIKKHFYPQLEDFQPCFAHKLSCATGDHQYEVVMQTLLPAAQERTVEVHPAGKLIVVIRRPM